jgi:hypothetical protein
MYDQSNKALEESVYFRKMAHCRALYHFFKKAERKDTPRREDDDILSEDFGFAHKELYGNEREDLLNRFNKDLFHLTYERLKRTPDTKPWPMDALFLPVAQQSKEFIEHILTCHDVPVTETERALWTNLKAAAAANLPLQQNTKNVAESQISYIELKHGS